MVLASKQRDRCKAKSLATPSCTLLSERPTSCKCRQAATIRTSCTRFLLHSARALSSSSRAVTKLASNRCCSCCCSCTVSCKARRHLLSMERRHQALKVLLSMGWSLCVVMLSISATRTSAVSVAQLRKVLARRSHSRLYVSSWHDESPIMASSVRSHLAAWHHEAQFAKNCCTSMLARARRNALSTRRFVALR